LGATMPGSRHAAIVTQAQSMGKKFDNYEQTWKNAAPSANYEAPMPNVSQAAIEARAALDPNYRSRAVMQAAPVTVQSGEPTAKSATGETLVVRNGQWVPAKQP